MKSKVADWFETSVQYNQIEGDLDKTFKEKYTVEAVNFTDAEARITEELGANHGFYVKAITRARYREVFFNDNPNADEWFKAQVQYKTEIESDNPLDTEPKETTSIVYFLVQASDIKEAVDIVREIASGSMINHVIGKITRTQFEDVLTA